MTRPTLFLAIAVGLLAVAAAILAVPLDARETSGAHLETIPLRLGGFHVVGAPPAGALPLDERVDAQIARAYDDGRDRVWTVVEYYAAQSDARRPLAREVLVPRVGWNELSEHAVSLALDGGRTLSVNLILMRTHERRLATAYWYQIGRSSVASDHLYRARLVLNRVVARRSDGALVRVAVLMRDGEDAAAPIATLTRFVREFHPELLRSLPE